MVGPAPGPHRGPGGRGVVLLVGLVDDFHPLRPVFKLATLFLAALILQALGVTTGQTPWPAANLALSLLWMAGVTGALNSLDNTDGVAGGTSAVSALVVFLIAWQTWQAWLSLTAVALAGACLGFLRFNFAPARIYLGNNGSFVLGFLLAAITMLGDWSAHPLKALFLQILILAAPLADIGLVTFFRWRRGAVRTPVEAITYSGRDHLAHRLRAAGLSVGAAAVLFCAFAAASGLLAAWLYSRGAMDVLAAGLGYAAAVGRWP